MKIISYWLPFYGAGIKVASYNLDQGQIKVSLRRKWGNGNGFGTHFGGSLFSMCDPWYVFLAIHHLGSGYIVWDLSADIEFIKAVKEPVFADFRFTKEDAEEAIKKTQNGDKYCPEFDCEIRTKSGELVAKVKKRVYIRKKRPKVAS